MRCLYIVSRGPITPNGSGGGSAIYYDQMMVLRESGCDIHLWHFATTRQRLLFGEHIKREPETWRKVQDACSSIQLTTVAARPSLAERVHGRLSAITHPNLLVARWDHIATLRQLLADIQPDFVWAHHLEAATLSARMVNTPFVYFHHDWRYRISALRSGKPQNAVLKRREEAVSRSAFTVVTGSAYERNDLLDLGCRRVHYIPVAYEPVAIEMADLGEAKPRLVHLGGMGTTANRQGLLSFFEKAWPALGAQGFRLDVIGDLKQAPEALQQHLREVNCLGFVNDLSTVLRPYDLQIIPWKHPTGQRTKVPAAMNYGQVIIACRGGVAGFEELQSERNCILVDSVEEMPRAIRLVAENSELRVRLAKAAKATFENHFTRQALLPKYQDLLGELCEALPARIHPDT
jgi:glycosyltransferase involved in cell wall biosynthesis